MNSIDLSLAPKDATHYTKETKTTNACWVNIKQAPFKYVTMSEVHHNKDSYIWQIGEFPSSELIELDIKPVYTQAMSDHDILPKVGMMVAFIDEASKTIVECEILMYHKLSVFVSIDGWDGGHAISSTTKFKPLDTRTDTEKAIDDLEGLFYKAMPTNEVLESIKAGNIHGVTWSGE